MPNISYKHFIYDHELMLYPYAPLGLLHNQGEWPEPKYKLSIIITASVKDLNIIQWITYHQSLGIDHIYLYCTDEDPTDLYRQVIAFTLGKSPYITFLHFRFSELKTQQYFHFIRNYLHETEWYIHLDIDDYLYIHDKQTISNFLNNFSDINAVYFNTFPFKSSEINESVNKTISFEPQSLVAFPCIYTKLMVRSHACPYQYIFYNLDKALDHHIESETLINKSCNVLKQNMSNYYKDFPNNALEMISVNTQEQIITTAYIARFYHENDEHQMKYNLSKSYINNDIEIKHQNNVPSQNLQHYNPEKYWGKILKKVWNKSFISTSSFTLLSKDKPCKLSSISKAATSDNVANALINNQLQGLTQTITNIEKNPSWEIDLLESYIVKNIRLFNGIDPNIVNMKNFIIESSDDYQTWIKRHQKVTSDLFGGVDGSYYNWVHPLGVKARWIRITVPGNNKIFSLDQIQILGIEYKNWYIA